jgi:F1F0 ATPase subunit 2
MDAPQVMTFVAIPTAAVLPMALLTGFLLGLVHFRTLRTVCEGYAGGRICRAAMLQLLRMLVVGAILYAFVRLGAGALFAGALGLIAARAVIVRHIRRER